VIRKRPHKVGDTFTFERSFTEEDVTAFRRLTGDNGRHHVELSQDGRRVVHGLLTASMPTKLGGDLDFLAREMVFEFLLPVFTGDRLFCEMTIDEVSPGRRGTRLTLVGACHNQDGVEVMRFRSRGIVLDRGA
jgi:acyl dehydratase